MKRISLIHGTTFLLSLGLVAQWLFGAPGLVGHFMDLGGANLPFNSAFATALIVLFIILNGLFVSSETAVGLLRSFHVKHTREEHEVKGQRLQTIIDDRVTYATASALGSRLCWLALGLLSILMALGLAVPSKTNSETVFDAREFLLHLLYIGFPVTLVTLTIGELIPKSYASLHPHGVALKLFRFIQYSASAFSIPASILVATANVVTHNFGGKASFILPNEREDEIRDLVDSAQEEGQLEEDQKELFHSVFDFTGSVAREVMTPRVDLDAMPVRSSIDEIVRVMRESGHTRIPLYEETDDQIVGIVHAKDLLMAMIEKGPDVNIRALLRPVLYVPEGKNLSELLAEMRVSRGQMAIVQDEFGGTAGIVTIEDIVEELVGDIVDEYDEEEPDVVPAGPDGFLVDGKTDIDDVNDEVGAKFESDEFNTIGGFVFGQFGRQPKQGESIEADGFLFSVIETDGRRILKLRIEPVEAASDDSDDREPRT